MIEANITVDIWQYWLLKTSNNQDRFNGWIIVVIKLYLVFTYCFLWSFFVETYFRYKNHRHPKTGFIKIRFTLLRKRVFPNLYLIGVVRYLKEFRQINFCSQYDKWLAYNTIYNRSSIITQSRMYIIIVFSYTLSGNLSKVLKFFIRQSISRRL